MIEYTKLQEINKTLKATDIKGKEYIEVNERLKAFWQLCPEGRIETSIYSLENGVCIIKAYVYENKTDERPRATGVAYEKEGSTFINKTSYIENCETSAIGRALGIAGIGINTSVASAEEVQNAIIQQDSEKTIDKTHADALKMAIENAMLDVNGTDKEVLAKYGYKEIKEIKMKDYMKIVEEFKKIKKD
jgi:hypothetical protein